VALRYCGAGAVVSGLQQQKMANYQAAQAEADAEAAKASAKVEAERIRKAGRSMHLRLATLRVTSGITGDAEQDAFQTILSGNNQGARLNAQAQADRISGRNAATSGYISAGSSLLSAGSKYSGWVTAKDKQK
jgi:hypothetical protein